MKLTILPAALVLAFAMASTAAFASGHDGKAHGSPSPGSGGSTHDVKIHTITLTGDENEGKHDREHDAV